MRHSLLVFCFAVSFVSSLAHADEQLLGYVRGAETLPEKSWEIYQFVTSRDDKGQGSYHAIDTTTEVEYGVSDRFNAAVAVKMMSLHTTGLVIDGYLPNDNSFGLQPSAIELEAKYNFLSPAKDDWGLSVLWSVYRGWVDPHSGQDKTTYSFENLIIAQKYFLEGQLIASANLGLEATHADRDELEDLPAGFDWPTDPEMEIETIMGVGLSYRFIPNWFIGAEGLYEAEYETEVNRERYSLFAGPSLHYGSEKWWTTITYFPQIVGGGEKYPDQADQDLHLVEKTKQEIRLKLGFNF